MPSPDRKAAAEAIESFLRAIGRDPATEPDLEGTGARVADAFVDELCAGYDVDTRALLAAASLAAPDAPPVVVVRDIPVTTTCPHHLMPAIGVADVALQPRSQIVGIGAIAELVDAHAHRLTLQEHIGERVVADIADVLSPAWVACRLALSHGCMVARGTRPIGARVETLSVRGADAAFVAAILGGARGAEPRTAAGAGEGAP